jgi:hypothetical protein
VGYVAHHADGANNNARSASCATTHINIDNFQSAISFALSMLGGLMFDFQAYLKALKVHKPEEINNVEFIAKILAFTMDIMHEIDKVSKDWI